ncbi:helicase-like protein [Paraburkholderia sp. BL6665CI2N2]|uniref:DEAD/DEAH box helicase family protein n=1 Tax=Paraburkholderia sp. BL6665CI2N2 TaxID=1938806 RepID=UPI001066154F|nr:DEAD/DEAH box helicase family protein [Paraburkholderia sp. BL6665CI2N2]TDY24585.1 helicase-like protein [Paraburkholderia sp. BL6665CI2N2]
MSQSVHRADPAAIPSTLKEAVVDGILNLTYAQLSGQGPTGRYLFGARPRVLLNSGFLLPQRSQSGDDEVTSPIWVSSHGLQTQLNATSPSIVMVAPRLSLYVRILPREQDLKRPNCRPVFMLRQAVVEELKAERDRRLDDAWERVKGDYTSKRKHPNWAEIRKKIVDDVYSENGIPRYLLTSDLPQEPLEPEAEESVETDTAGESVSEGAVVDAEAPLPIKDEHFEPLTVPHKWMRLEVELPTLELDTLKSKDELERNIEDHAVKMQDAVAKRLQEWAQDEDPEWGGKAWGYRRLLTIPASQYTKWSDFLESVRKSELRIALPEIRLSWDLSVHTDWLDPSKRNLFLALENVSQMPQQHVDDTEEAVFLVSLQVQFPTALHHPLRLERIDPSYRYNKYLEYPAMGHNCGVLAVGSGPERLVLETTWAPRYIQPRIVPTRGNGVQRQVRTLSSPDGLDGLAPLVPAMQEWLNALPSQMNLAEGLNSSDADGLEREVEAFHQDLEKWRSEMSSVAAGLDCLRESKEAWRMRGAQGDPKAIVFEAWLAMNETMADFMKIRFGHDDNEWRLFQLAFVIANIPALASRISEFAHCYDERRDDAVTLLYFATGGGKSEAFFGLLVFNLILDRLRGKHRGVTALIRYPLRLLTIQQAQRCARVLAQGERVRRRHGYGGAPLSIGFWVGSGGSPNRHNTKGIKSIPDVSAAPPFPAAEKALREDDAKYSAAMRAWRKLPLCPYCNNETALRLFVEDGDQTLGHVCTDIHCDSNGGQWRPLPFYIVDEDIYDLAPSVLLGTVDKLALIGHSSRTIRRIFGMFGAAPWVNMTNGRLYVPTESKELSAGPEAKGMTGVYPAYRSGQRIFHDPFPSLIIQDEAHLLDESLGTFAGLFESTLDAIFASLSKPLNELIAVDVNGRRRRAKVIAASATVSEPQRQLEHLYQRSIPATQFPEPGPSLYESFYAKPAVAAVEEATRRANPDIEVASRQGRVYAAFMTNGKPHTSTSVAVLSGFHLTITRLYDGLTSGVSQDLQTARLQLADHVSPGPLRNLHRQVVLAAGASELATLVDLHRIALTYVTNKKGGDQIMAAEAEETRKRHLNEGIDLGGLDTRLITGSVEQGEIQAVVDTAQRRVNPGMPLPPVREQLRSVIATSAISHGVDVDEFNSMFFAGMPSDIAEYIQASSRVGRTHIGFVVLVPTPQRRRDRHIVHVFDIFHRFLERMVQPAAIDRWAERAIERVFPSLFQAYLLGVVPSRELIRLPEDEKNKTPDFRFIPNVRREFKSRGDAFINEIDKFIELAVGLRDEFSPEGEEHYRRRIDERTRNLIVDTWSSALWGSGTMDGYFKGQTDPMLKPMTSLRDVDLGGVIQASFRDAIGKRQSPSEVQLVMDLVRHGVANNDGTDNARTGD